MNPTGNLVYADQETAERKADEARNAYRALLNDLDRLNARLDSLALDGLIKLGRETLTRL